MRLVLLTCGIGVLVGLSRGGRLEAIGRLCLRSPAVVWVALGAQLSLGLPVARDLPPSARHAVTLASYAAVGVWLALNAAGRRQGLRAAFAAVAAGWALNVVAIVPNGGMPVSEAAMARSGVPVSTAVSEGHLWKHVPATSETVLAELGDVLPLPPLRAVVSVGDLFIFAGMAGVVAGAMRIEEADRARDGGSAGDVRGRSGGPLRRSAPAGYSRRRLRQRRATSAGAVTRASPARPTAPAGTGVSSPTARTSTFP